MNTKRENLIKEQIEAAWKVRWRYPNHDAQNIRISNNGNSFEWDEPQAPGVVFSTQRIWRE